MFASAVPTGLTMRVDFGESPAVSGLHAMGDPSQKSLPQSVEAGVFGRQSSSAVSMLDDVMDRYARGDDAVFEVLYRQGAPRLRGFLVRLCSDGSLADDLTQEAFLRIHLARGSFLEGAAALPWMLAIARNAFLDHIRRERVRRSTGGGPSEAGRTAHAVAPPETRGDEVLVARELLGVVSSALDRMTLLQREAFVLLRFQGLSVRDAAQVLGATEAAVKVRAFRAYEAIRAALDQEGVDSTAER